MKLVADDTSWSQRKKELEAMVEMEYSHPKFCNLCMCQANDACKWAVGSPWEQIEEYEGGRFIDWCGQVDVRCRPLTTLVLSLGLEPINCRCPGVGSVLEKVLCRVSPFY